MSKILSLQVVKFPIWLFQNNKMGHRINKWLFQNNKMGHRINKWWPHFNKMGTSENTKWGAPTIWPRPSLVMMPLMMMMLVGRGCNVQDVFAQFFRCNQFCGEPRRCNTILKMSTKCFLHLLVLNKNWKSAKLPWDHNFVSSLSVMVQSVILPVLAF